jgi:aldehyde:ferredoxin oxidoreductase
VKIAGDLWALYDSLPACKFTTYPEGGIGVARLCEMVVAATGWNITVSDLMTVGERAFNLCRAFNVREGMSRKDDTLPPRLMEPMPGGPYKGEIIARASFDETLDKYYGFRGWDEKTGIPKKKTLERLNVKYVADELERIGELPA